MAGRLKILGVHYGGGLGGAPISLVQLLGHLPRDEFDPAIAFTESGPIREVAAEHGVRSSVVNAPAAFLYSAHAALAPRMLWRLARSFRSSVAAAERMLQAERPDLVHLNTSVLLPFAIAANRLGIPVLWHVREVLGPSPWLRRWHGGFLCRRAAVLVATSHAVRSCLPCPERVKIVPNGVDLGQYRLELLEQRDAIRDELGIDPNDRVVAILGSVQRVKGHWLLLDAVDALQTALPQVRVMVVAGGVPSGYAGTFKGRVKRALGLPFDNLELLQRDAQDRRLKRLFYWTGFRTDIPRVLAACDALVFPSLRPEGFGRPLIEAMAMARPVVATDLGPSREIVEPDVSGLLVSPSDPLALAQCLFQLLTDAALGERLGRAGRERVERDFSLPQHVDRMVELYRSAVSP